jgi:hypothetical protein
VDSGHKLVLFRTKIRGRERMRGGGRNERNKRNIRMDEGTKKHRMC